VFGANTSASGVDVPHPSYQSHQSHQSYLALVHDHGEE